MVVDQAAAYIEMAEVLEVLQPGVRKAELVPFEPGADESAQRVVAAALRHAYLFSDPESVGSLAPEFQREMRRWLDDPDATPAQVVGAGAALTASRIVELGSGDLDDLAERVARLRGCAGTSTFLSVEGTADGTCSLVLTVQAVAIPPYEVKP